MICKTSTRLVPLRMVSPSPTTSPCIAVFNPTICIQKIAHHPLHSLPHCFAPSCHPPCPTWAQEHLNSTKSCVFIVCFYSFLYLPPPLQGACRPRSPPSRPLLRTAASLDYWSSCQPRFPRSCVANRPRSAPQEFRARSQCQGGVPRMRG